MELIAQTNEYECGICCLLMLLREFFPEQHYNKQILYQNTYIDKSGLSLLQLELLAIKFGIFLDSYECSWNELSNLDDNIPFLMLLNQNEYLHYVVVEKKKNKLILYDPRGVVKTTDLNEKIPEFSNIILTISRIDDSQLDNIKSDNDSWKLKNNKFILFTVFLNFLVLSLELFCSFLTSKLINKINDDGMFIATFVFGIIIFYITDCLLEYVLFIIRQKLLLKQYFLYLILFVDKLNLKIPLFYQTIDANVFNNAFSLLKQNILWHNDFIANLTINVSMLLVLIVVIILIEPSLLFFLIFNIIIYLILTYFNHHFQKKQANVSIQYLHQKENDFISLQSLNKGHLNKKFTAFLLSKWTMSNKQYEQNQFKINKKITLLELLKNLWNKLYFLLIIICFLFLNENYYFSILFFSLQVFNFANQSINTLIDSISNFINFKIIKEMLNNLINLNNSNAITLTNFNAVSTVQLSNSKIEFSQILDTKIKNTDKLIYFKYEQLNETILNLLSFINFDNYDEPIKQTIIQKQWENKLNSQFDFLLIYLLYLNQIENYEIIIDIDFTIDDSHPYYIYYLKLMKLIIMKNNVYMNNQLLLKNLNYKNWEYTDEKSL